MYWCIRQTDAQWLAEREKQWPKYESILLPFHKDDEIAPDDPPREFVVKAYKHFFLTGEVKPVRLSLLFPKQYKPGSVQDTWRYFIQMNLLYVCLPSKSVEAIRELVVLIEEVDGKKFSRNVNVFETMGNYYQYFQQGTVSEEEWLNYGIALMGNSYFEAADLRGFDAENEVGKRFYKLLSNTLVNLNNGYKPDSYLVWSFEFLKDILPLVDENDVLDNSLSFEYMLPPTLVALQGKIESCPKLYQDIYYELWGLLRSENVTSALVDCIDKNIIKFKSK